MGKTIQTLDGSLKASLGYAAAGHTHTLASIGAAASSHTHNYAGSSSAGGAANSATKLASARTLTIGSTGKSFDGSANVSWSLSEIGAAAASHGTHVTYSTTAPKVAGTAAVGSESTVARGDHVHAAQTSVSGNAGSATKLATARNIVIGNKTNSFNGTANITYTLADIGAFPVAGGSLSGPITGETRFVGSNLTYSDPWENTACALKVTGKIAATDTIKAPTFNGALSGNANSATKLATARTITIGNKGNTFDGSANITYTLSDIGAAATSHTHNQINNRGKVTCESGVTGRPAVAGLSMSEAYNNGYPTAYGNVISLKGAGDGQILVGWSGTDGAHAPVYVRSKRDNTSTANWSEWAQVYTTANKPTYSDVGAAAASHGTHVTWSTTAPKVAGTASVGSETKVARGDHVHAAQTSVSGNAGTATKLQTARTLTIGSTGKSFDGSGNVSWSHDDMGVAKGQRKTATTAATAQWYRIAQSSASINNCLGQFEVRAAVSGKHSVTLLTAGTSYGIADGTFVQQLSHTQYSATGISKARIVYHTTYNNNYAYLEVYVPTATATELSVSLTEGFGWTLVAPNTVGSIPSEYSNKEITLVQAKIVSNVKGSLDGNAGSATKLATARNIALGGVLSGSASFNGTANVTISAAITAPPKSGDWFSGGMPVVGTDGVLEIGKYIDFHNTDASTNDYDVRLQADTSTPCIITLPTAAGTLARTVDNVSSATKLQTARNIVIGNKTNSFNGTANISYTLSDIGALPTAGGTMTGNITFADVTSTTYPAVSSKISWNGSTDGADIYYQVDASDKGRLVLNTRDDADCIIMFANKGASKATIDTSGNFSGKAATAGTADKATTLATARTITIGNKSNSFNGSANISYTLSDIGAVAKSGDSMSGSITFNNDQGIAVKNTSGTQCYIAFIDAGNTTVLGNPNTKLTIRSSETPNILVGSTWHTMYHTGNKPSLSDIGAAASSHGTHVTYSTTAPKVAGTAAVGSESTVARGDHVHAAQTSVSGNAGSATKLATARTLTIGSTGKSFDGSANVSWSLSEIGAAASSHTHNYAGSSSAGGAANSATKLATARTITIGNKANNFDGSANISFTLADIGAATSGHTHSSVASTDVLNQNTKMDYGWSGLNYFNISGTAGNAAKVNDTPTSAWWHILRCNHANSSGYYTDIAVPFNAKSMYYKRITNGAVQDNGWVKMLDALNFNEYAAAKSHGTHVTYSSTAPKVAGTASAGSESSVARGDHVHAAQTSVSGNAGTATKLATARNIVIGNKTNSFDGSGNITFTLADIGAAASSHGTHLTIGTGASNAAAGNHTHSSYATTTTTGSLSSLQTSAKGSLVAAINEVFQSGSNAKTKLVNALTAKGITASTSDSWDTLIGKLSDIAATQGANNIYAATSLPATGNTNDICIVSSPLPNHIHIGRIKPTSVDANDIWLDTDGTNLDRPYRTITVGKLSTNLKVSSAYRLTSSGGYAAQVVAYYWDGSKWVVCCPVITTLESTDTNSTGSITLGSGSKYDIKQTGYCNVTINIIEGIQYTGKCTVRVNHSYSYGTSGNVLTYTLKGYNKNGSIITNVAYRTTVGSGNYYYFHDVNVPDPGGYIQVQATTAGSNPANDEYDLYVSVGGNKA